VYNKRRILMLLTFSIVPLILIIKAKTGLLTGWRHGYFIYIPLVVFSAIAYTYLLEHKLSKSLHKKILVSIILIGLLPTFLFMIRNYPIFYIYFNPTSGGIKKALGNYEIDYYTHSAKPATDWLIKNVSDLQNYKITSNNALQVGAVLSANKFNNPVTYSRYRERYDQDWDYGVFTHSFIDIDYLKNGYFPPKGTIKSIEIDGVSVCAIIKREDKNDFYGKRAIDSNQFAQAIMYLNKAVQYDPNNEVAWTNLGLAYLQSNQPAQAIESLNRALIITPENMMAKNYLGYAYLNTGNVANAQYIFLQMVEENPNNPEPYKILAQIYQQQGNSAAAQQYMNAYQQITGQVGP
jgi:tetratricopeptide (TPR) repeat protein